MCAFVCICEGDEARERGLLFVHEAIHLVSHASVNRCVKPSLIWMVQYALVLVAQTLTASRYVLCLSATSKGEKNTAASLLQVAKGFLSSLSKIQSNDKTAVGCAFGQYFITKLERFPVF